jgi:hypothetical protein
MCITTYFNFYTTEDVIFFLQILDSTIKKQFDDEILHRTSDISRHFEVSGHTGWESLVQLIHLSR